MNVRSNEKRDKKIFTNILFPILLGAILGVVQKLVDDPDIISEFHILDYMFGRFGIWIFIAVLLVISAKSQRYAITRVFLFFVCMLVTYYAYTVIFLNFTPKNQMILWGTICLITPICAIIVWNACKHKWSSNVFGGLLISILFTEWYIMTKLYDERILMFILYTIMVVYMIKRISKSILQAVCITLIASILSFILIYTGYIQYILHIPKCILLNIDILQADIPNELNRRFDGQHNTEPLSAASPMSG